MRLARMVCILLMGVLKFWGKVLEILLEVLTLMQSHVRLQPAPERSKPNNHQI